MIASNLHRRFKIISLRPQNLLKSSLVFSSASLGSLDLSEKPDSDRSFLDDEQQQPGIEEYAGYRCPKGEVGPLCCVEPIEKPVKQEDQILSNPHQLQTARKHK